jgi:hypothetical protein
LLPQFVTVGTGQTVACPHALAMTGKLTVGGAFTVTVFVATALPHAPVMRNESVYVPGLLNVNDGLAEVAFVPFAKLHEEEVPQNPEA